MNNLNKSFTENNPIIRVFNATKYSIKGFKSAFKTEQAFRQDFLCFLINMVCIYFFVYGKADKIWISWLFCCGVFLLMAELVNTAIEYIIDRISNEVHPLSGMAKDVGSAIVFLAVVNLLTSWIIFAFF